MPNQKVFFIGFNKTGTVSYHHAFESVIGERAIHHPVWTDWAFYKDKNNLDKYDVFTDGECANLKNLDELYPDAKYVLNTRELQVWLTSRHKSIERSRKTVRWAFRKFLPLPRLQRYITKELLRNNFKGIRTWFKLRDRYHAYVIDFFKDRPEDLLICDISDKGCFDKLRDFTGIQIPSKPEHKNDSGADLGSGKMVEALGLKVDANYSVERVQAFLEKSKLQEKASEKVLVRKIKPYSRSKDASSLLKFFVNKRAKSRAFLSKYFYDLFIAKLRHTEDMNRFVPIRKYGAGSQ